MKAEISIPPEIISAIAQEVAGMLKPMLAARKQESPDVILSPDQLAEYLGGVSKDWIYGRTAKNELPFIKVGHLVRFRRSEIDRWLSERSVRAVSPLSRPLPVPRLEAGKTRYRDMQSRGREGGR